ncbi:MAG: GNAT family N-acetyltransferase [Marinicaulis sp.]|nr:GNAT family N-acetyltransferase [Marinicaulis sp.]NNE39675.1 GNAT family N-acetyltransferase [Marinicaulis sp.]NNL90423.1 GNAT family N-acetyltransferase [Marinicaulis sp.]
MIKIQTDDLLLRSILRDDAERFFVLCNDEQIARNTARIPSPYTMEQARKFATNASVRSIDSEYVFAICRNGEIVGCVAVTPDDNPKNKSSWEIGYWVGAAYRRTGVATRAVCAISTFAFEQLGAETVTAGFFVDNPASGRVLKRCGFVPTGECRSLYSVGRGEEVATIRMVLSKADSSVIDAVKIVGDQ